MRGHAVASYASSMQPGASRWNQRFVPGVLKEVAEAHVFSRMDKFLIQARE